GQADGPSPELGLAAEAARQAAAGCRPSLCRNYGVCWAAFIISGGIEKLPQIQIRSRSLRRSVCWKSMLNARERPHFPPIEAASPDGVLFVGGSLAPDWMLEAYRRGIFPMPIKVDRRRLIAWLAPDPRGVLQFESLHISRRLARRLRRGEFEFTLDQAFGEVVEGCAAPRGHDDDCWLTLSMQNAYLTLHALGHAHSVEVWQNRRLVGGLFGVAIGGLFAAESMFHRVTD